MTSNRTENETLRNVEGGRIENWAKQKGWLNRSATVVSAGMEDADKQDPVDTRKRTLEVSLSGRNNARFQNSSYFNQGIRDLFSLAT